MKHYIILALLSLLVYSCKKEGTDTTPVVLPPDMVLVLNEGNYTFGNTSITLYDPVEDTLRQNLFTSVNGTLLGDVANSMAFYNGHGYIVVNNSGKIEVVDMDDFSSVATITGLTSPRYLLPLDDGRAYVSDLYAEKLAILNLASNTVTGYIDLPGWTEQMAEHLDLVYVANYDSSRVDIINTIDDTKIADIPLSGHPLNLVTDLNGNLWVATEKDLNGNSTGTIVKINLGNRQVQEVKTYTGQNRALELTYNRQIDALFYIDNDQVKMATLSPFQEETVATRPGANLYTVGVSPNGTTLYVADALDFNQNGKVYIYELPAGTLKDSFATGVIPGEVVFYP